MLSLISRLSFSSVLRHTYFMALTDFVSPCSLNFMLVYIWIAFVFSWREIIFALKPWRSVAAISQHAAVSLATSCSYYAFDWLDFSRSPHWAPMVVAACSPVAPRTSPSIPAFPQRQSWLSHNGHIDMRLLSCGYYCYRGQRRWRYYCLSILYSLLLWKQARREGFKPPFKWYRTLLPDFMFPWFHAL